MKTQALIKAIEKITGELLHFPGKNRGDFYYPIRKSNPKSERFWVRFYGDYAGNWLILGDFATDKREKFPFPSSIDKFKTTEKLTADSKGFEKLNQSLSKKFKTLLDSKEKGFNDYLSLYKESKPLGGLNADGSLLFPFERTYFQKEREILAVQSISKTGVKKYLAGSETIRTASELKTPTNKESFIYITEGIRTGYAAVLGSPEGSGVLAAGSLFNVKNILQDLNSAGYKNIVLAGESTGFEKYLNLKNSFNCLLIGSKQIDDLHSFFEKTDLETLKAFMVTFKASSFVPLGLDSKNRIGIYLKNQKISRFYKQNEQKVCYSDCYNTGEPPSKKAAEEHYFSIRKLCRTVGVSSENAISLSYGIIPIKENYLFYDQELLYLIKENKILPLKKEDVNYKDIILTKNSSIKSMPLTSLSPLSSKEFEDISKISRLFKLNSNIDNKLVLGWIVQGLLCGGMLYRTPLWITGKSRTGKGVFGRRFIFSCFPVSEKAPAGRTTTPAWIVRQASKMAVPFFRDEYEPSFHKTAQLEEEMEYVRNTATERFPKRGIAAGADDGTLSFIYCFAPLYTSIKRPNLSEGDLGRFLMLDLKLEFKEAFESQITAFENWMDNKMKHRFLKSALLKLHSINKSYKELMAHKELQKILSHQKSTICNLAACHNALFEPKITVENIKKKLGSTSLVQGFSKYSKIVRKMLLSICDRNTYNLEESKLLLYMLDDYISYKDFLNANGFYLYKNFLLIDHKRGTIFASQLLKMDIKNTLANFMGDGDYLIQADFRIGEVKDGPPRKTYFKFDWIKIKEDLL